MPDLIDAYLHHLNNVASPEDAVGQELFEISYIDVFGMPPQFFSIVVTHVLSDQSFKRTLHHIPGCPNINSTLLHHGCLGSSPLRISLAISLCTLELFRHLHLRQPRVSIQAWIRVLCDMHNVSTYALDWSCQLMRFLKTTYRHAFWKHFSNTFDIYLKILEGVRRRINVTLNRTADDWRIKHSCPPCQYKVFLAPWLH